ncbi:hypothetical protein JM946_17400 [Steroidobacter sp. S1-65]|uniref:Uncharacterized protein n=1 Tax=Steroidobacter gossypii TaxID=2805490 RepID=A0ABS1WZU2_9GAMM|nr:hypothetical protein [Steroidobacter gossypii]MBM0106508.1 hypothetical protein [Steroidobacter gossypii]
MSFDSIEYSNDDVLPLQVSNLAQTLTVLQAIPVVEAPMMRVGISDVGLQQIASALVGTEVHLPALADSRISVSEAAIQTVPGELRVTLGLIGRSPAMQAEVALSGTGAILFERYALAADARSLHAVYRVHIERLAPAFRVGLLSVRTRKWANELLRSRALEQFSEVLTFKIPVPSMPELPLGFVREDTTFIEDTGATYVIRSELPASKLSWPLAVQLPIVSADGLHILATAAPNDLAKPAVNDASPEELAMQRSELMGKVQALTTRLPELTAPIELTVHRRLFEQLVAQVNALPGPARTVSYRLMSWRGRLVDEIHEAELVGKGGYYVEFKDQNSASAKVQIANLTSAWSEHGLTLATSLSANAQARLNVHIDPYIGGGFDFDMGIEGDATAPVDITLAARKLGFGDRIAFVIGPVLRCAQFPLIVQGGGSVKFGVEMYELIGEHLWQPTVLLTDLSQHVPLLPEVNSHSLRHAATYLQVRPVPQAVEVLTDAYQFRAALQVTRHVGAISIEAGEGKLSEAALAALESAWGREVVPTCPAKPASKFLFAGQDFGPNNAAVKVLRDIGRSIGLTKHNAKIAWGDVETVIEDPGKAPEKVAEIAVRVGREVERAGERIERDVLKPAKKLIKKLKF